MNVLMVRAKIKEEDVAARGPPLRRSSMRSSRRSPQAYGTPRLIDVSEEWCFGEFLPILIRQRDHARDHGQADWAALFDGLIQRTAATERS